VTAPRSGDVLVTKADRRHSPLGWTSALSRTPGSRPGRHTRMIQQSRASGRPSSAHRSEHVLREPPMTSRPNDGRGKGQTPPDRHLRRRAESALANATGSDACALGVKQTAGVLPIVGIRPLSGRTGTTLLMNLLGTSRAIAFDRRYPAEYRIGSYLARMALAMTEPFDEQRHQGVTDFFFGAQPSWVPMPFTTDALEVKTWRPLLLRAMWASASDAMIAARPAARWYAEKLAVDEAPLREAGIEVLRIDLVRDPRDLLASRRAFRAGGTESWVRGAEDLARELMTRLDDLDADPPDLRLRYEDLAGDLNTTARALAERLGVELRPELVDRPAHHVTTASVAASMGRWRSDLTDIEAAALAPVVDRLGY